MKRSGVSRTSRLDTSSAVAVLFWGWLWSAVWAGIISCKTSAVGRSEPHRGDDCRVSASRVTRLGRPLTAVVASVVIIPLGAIATSAADLRSPASRLAPSTSYTRVVMGVHESVSDVKLEHRINTYPLAPSVYDFVPQPARSSSASVPRRGPRAPAELAAVEARASFSRVGMAAESADEVVGVASNAPKITFGHGARHLEGTGLGVEEVESTILQRVTTAASQATSETGSFWGRIEIRGTTIEYRAYTLPDGTINVGTYYVP